jgi:Putative zinc dependent peptidase (DUF5700)
LFIVHIAGDLVIRPLVAALVLFLSTIYVHAEQSRVQIRLDTSEAEAVLRILDLHAAAKKPTDTDWQQVFSSAPYVLLKQREHSMKRDFTDDQFKDFVLSRDLAGTPDELRRTLDEWKQADMKALAERVLTYLPDTAKIETTVYPLIKPMHNSFVYRSNGRMDIYLYLDPKRTRPQFENTVAHELHHIGLGGLETRQEAALARLSDNQRAASQWLGAFGEGMAMLAAAGSPDIHPHTTSDATDRARWDRDMANFNQDLQRVQKFLFQILDGKLTPDQQQEPGMAFFGQQGPWYTVGYKMAVMVEKRHGRKALITCMLDPRKLLRRYNIAAGYYNATHHDKLARWSQELLDKLAVPANDDDTEAPASRTRTIALHAH